MVETGGRVYRVYRVYSSVEQWWRLVVESIQMSRTMLGTSRTYTAQYKSSGEQCRLQLSIGGQCTRGLVGWTWSVSRLLASLAVCLWFFASPWAVVAATALLTHSIVIDHYY